MSRYTGPKVKICKRIGENIYGTPKIDAALAKKGARGVKKGSEYSRQLTEKQKARFMYGVTERQFKNYFLKAARRKGVTGTQLIKILEERVDNVLFRAGIAATRLQARQMISHGHFELNGHRITVPSIAVKVGDTLQLKKNMQSSPLYVGFAEIAPMKWIKTDTSKKTVSIDRLPEDDEIEKTINAQLIVEFYSR